MAFSPVRASTGSPGLVRQPGQWRRRATEEFAPSVNRTTSVAPGAGSACHAAASMIADVDLPPGSYASLVPISWSLEIADHAKALVITKAPEVESRKLHGTAQAFPAFPIYP